ncbi:MAG: adenylosuccinate lyase, partial [Patescibacteria group bacterium]|nr:adenylosuccinate lyase [Patescibacteria group bacterium]
MVEAAWVLKLVEVLPDVPPLSAKSKKALQIVASGKSFSVNDMAAVKAKELTTNHDIKALELVLRENFVNDGLLNNHLELIHFGVTSDDIKNLAEALS